jgi:predicted transcriptional regulator
MTSRYTITRCIHRSPGIHFNELVRELDRSPEQVQRDLGKLREDGSFVSVSLYGQTHYYPPKFDAWERGALAMLRRETAREKLIYLYEEGSSRPDDVTNAVGIARSTLEWHLGRLVETELVRKHREDDGRVVLELSRPDELEELLSEIRPLLPDRLLDRTTRLLDHILKD